MLRKLRLRGKYYYLINNYKKSGDQAGLDGEEAADRGRGVAARRAARVGIGTPYNSRYAQNRCQVGPTILFDRPRQDPPTPRFNRSPGGPPSAGAHAFRGFRSNSRCNLVVRLFEPTR
jgi:hypothetical protein